MTMSLMKAFVRARYGPPAVLELKEVDRPVPNDDDVLVHVRASSLNQGDLDYLYGKPFLTRMGTGLRVPRRPGLGFDAAGEVEAVGKDVTRFKRGDSVFADLTPFGHGAFAEYAVAPERAWAHTPAGLSYEEAATLPQAAVLAMQGLRGRGGIRAGSRVLVNGASGSVGPFAVQIAKALGAHVTAVCSPMKAAMVRELGADEVIDYTAEDYTQNGQRYDWILDVAGNRSIFDCRRALTARGVYVLLGGTTTRIFSCLFWGPLISLGHRKRMGFLWWKPFHGEDVARLKRLIADGGIKPVIDRTFTFNQTREALSYLETGKAAGKVVLSSRLDLGPTW
jgi:NADPH:quinone reductase-like Zn-dependent oxidoreductase